VPAEWRRFLRLRGGKAAGEDESIYPRGAGLRLVEEKTRTVEIAGKTVDVPYIIMVEE